MNHYFKFAVKQMLKNKLITIGSIFSMVMGLLVTVLIYTWVHNELSMDQFHKKLDKIYMPVAQQSTMDTPEPMNPSLFFKVDYAEFPEIETSTSAQLYTKDIIKLILKDKEYRGRALVVDSTFLQVFDFELIEGNRETILSDPSNLILTESMALKVFGDQDPLGETIKLVCDRKGVYQVAGIMEDPASNSSIHFDYLVPVHSQRFWGMAPSEQFVLVKENFDKEAFDEAIKLKGRNHPQFKESILSTVAFKDVYFDNELSSNLFLKFGNREEVNTLMFVALIVLLVSIFNFANLQTTHVYSQVKTRGIKQVNGATRLVFLKELIVSRLIYLILSFGFTLILFLLVSPQYFGFMGISLSFSFQRLLLYLLVGVFSFLLLAQVITLLQTSSVVKTQLLIRSLSKTKGSTVGKVLTTIQYVLAIALIIVTAVIYKQFNYMQNKDLGFTHDEVVSVKFFEPLPFDFNKPEEFAASRKKRVVDYELVKSELSKIPGVEVFSQGTSPIDGESVPMSWKLSQSNYDYTQVNRIPLDPGYDRLFGLDVIQGRFFSESLDRSTDKKVVINRAAMNYWGLKDIAGVKLSSSTWGGEDQPWEIIGVVEDFNYEHLSKKIEPLLMVFSSSFKKDFLIKLNADRFQKTLEDVKALFGQVNPKRPFTYTLLETKIQRQYERDKKLSEIFALFTLMGLMISSVGLFTFSLYETRKRIKEIGVRKVIGASVVQITSLLSISFIKWVFLAFLLAGPLSWWLMKGWLANFANQTQLSWWLFPLAGIATLTIAMFTVIGQTYMAARQNPVKSLRYE